MHKRRRSRGFGSETAGTFGCVGGNVGLGRHERDNLEGLDFERGVGLLFGGEEFVAIDVARTNRRGELHYRGELAGGNENFRLGRRLGMFCNSEGARGQRRRMVFRYAGRGRIGRLQRNGSWVAVVGHGWRVRALRSENENQEQGNESEYAGCDWRPCGPVWARRDAFLRDACAKASIEMRGRFAGNEGSDAAVDERCDFARVAVGFAAGIAFCGVGEEFGLEAGGEGACCGVGDPIGVFFAGVHRHRRLRDLLQVPRAKAPF
jgi:hypothetical protein